MLLRDQDSSSKRLTAPVMGRMMPREGSRNSSVVVDPTMEARAETSVGLEKGATMVGPEELKARTVLLETTKVSGSWSNC